MPSLARQEQISHACPVTVSEASVASSVHLTMIPFYHRHLTVYYRDWNLQVRVFLRW